MQELVITAIGPDRPGLVQQLTAPLLEAKANVADSRMINLRGQFAVILLAEVPDKGMDSVQESLMGVAQALGLTLTFRGEQAQEEPWPTTVGVPYVLKTYAMDQPGIVHRITELLHRNKVNVEELETRSQPRPQTGAPLFNMELVMTVPANVPIKTIRQQLEHLCDELNCDAEISQKGS